YCHEVYHFVNDLPLQYLFYNVSPIETNHSINIKDSKNIAIIRVDYFGFNNLIQLNSKFNIIVDDFTHNLEGIVHSEAHYKFGSLRKVLPVPVGGFVVSKYDVRIGNLTPLATKISKMKSVGMVRKLEYLKFNKGLKSDFRKLILEAEEKFKDKGTYSDMPIEIYGKLKKIDMRSLIQTKRINSEFIKTLL